MMDSRLPLQPEIIRVPLYPPREDIVFVKDEKDILNHTISNLFSVKSENVLLASSGTTAFLNGLKDHFPNRKKLALPSFFCPHFTFACANVGYELCFFDYVDFLTEENVDYIYHKGADIIIWPTFFGAKKRDSTLLNKLLRSERIVILDEAHAFPLQEKNPTNNGFIYSLVSFGKNKPLAGIAGGALISHHIPFRAQELAVSSLKMSSQPLRFTHLKGLLEEQYPKIILDSRLSYEEIGEIDASITRHHLEKHKETYQQRLVWWNVLKEILPCEWKSFINNCIGFPSILSLSLVDRFEFSKELTKSGIQTTFYYYPIPLISSFKDFPHQPLKETLDCASRVLILPWSLNQSKPEFEFLYETLAQLCK